MIVICRLIAQQPDAYPSGQGQRAVTRIMRRLAMGIGLLDNPAELQARIEEIVSHGSFNAELYAVTDANLMIHSSSV